MERGVVIENKSHIFKVFSYRDETTGIIKVLVFSDDELDAGK
jgi:hypothetical protein